MLEARDSNVCLVLSLCSKDGGAGDLKVKSEVAQSCPTLCDPMDCSLPGSSVHGIFQAIVLKWTAISFSKLKTMEKVKFLTLKLTWLVSHICLDNVPFCVLLGQRQSQNRNLKYRVVF